jgi:hypothetical protein
MMQNLYLVNTKMIPQFYEIWELVDQLSHCQFLVIDPPPWS